MPTDKTNITQRIFITLVKLTFILFLLQMLAGFMHIIHPIPLQSMYVEFSDEVLHSWTIIGDFIYYIFAQIFINIVFLVLVMGGAAIFISQLFNLKDKAALRLSIGLWVLSNCVIFLANQIFFPWSIFSSLHTPAMILSLAKIALIILGLFLLVVFLLAFMQIIIKISQSVKRIAMASLIGLLLVIGLTINYFHTFYPIKVSKQPNIIIIGIDSLRPDYIGIENPKVFFTPHLDNFLQQSVIFPNAFTPLARTFPAWMSILTGQDPKLNGIRLELLDLTKINASHTLSNELRHKGYTTIFATDDRRFNPISTVLGFDKVVGPKTGFSDFVLGTFNDFPLSNLVVNTCLGHWLFPYSYSNRGVATTYYPNTFLNYLSAVLTKTPQRPLFLAVHFTLSHWPYVWASSRSVKMKPGLRDEFYFKVAVKRVDQEFARFIHLLRQKQLLNNSLVFIISDHGNSWGFANERATSKKGYMASEAILSKVAFQNLTEPTFGHGTDILNLTQYHILFSIREFGNKIKFNPGRSAEIASLIDIKPTVLAFLNLPNNYVQGISLLPWLVNPNTKILNRDFYIESGFTLPGILMADPSIKNVLEQGASYFRIDPKTGFLITKDKFAKLIIATKQLGIIDYPWLLACYPVNQDLRILLLANTISLQWTTDLNSNLAKQADVNAMLTKLKNFYGMEFHC